MLTIPTWGTIWGWPWHGLIESGTIGTTGKAHPQPAICDSWLIDMGLPAITLTQAQQDEATAKGYEWRNYALLPGGYVCGAYMGANTFIHVDADSKCWLIALAFSFPASQTLRITASIKRFGLFGHGEQAAVEKIVDVSCTEIELNNAVSQATFGGPYTSREGKLQDVWTNGQKALIGVMLILGSGTDLFSLVELTPTGSGGTDGSGLSLAATEIKGQPALTTGGIGANVTIYTDNDLDDVVRLDIISNTYSQCPDPPGSATYTVERALYTEGVLQNQYTPSTVTHARYAFYAADGSPKAVRMRYGSIDTYVAQKLSDWSPLGFTSECLCTDPTQQNCTIISGGTPEMTYQSFQRAESGWTIYENDTIVDTLIHSRETTKVWHRTPSTADLVSEDIVYAWEGSLAGLLPAYTASTTFSGVTNILGHFRSTAMNDISSPVVISPDNVYIGLHRMNHNAIGFWMNNLVDTHVYGDIFTPLGPHSVTITPSANNRFAWQRKTLDHEFAPNLLAYV